MAYWLLLAYLLYGAGIGAWVGDHAHELAYQLVCILEGITGAMLAVKHVLRAAL